MDIVNLSISVLYQSLAQIFWAGVIMLPVSLPIILGKIVYVTYRNYTLTKALTTKKVVFLEVKLPREINKSPRAMEIALNAFYQTSEGNSWTQYFKGKHRDWFSLELISIEGSIYYIIRTTESFRNYIESQLYAQFPNIEIREVQDYTDAVDYLERPDAWDVFGVEFQFAGKEIYPLRTYVDYALDKDPKEEFKTDPLVGTLEHLGSLGKGEQMWIQFLVMPTKRDKELKAAAQEEIKTLLKRDQSAVDGAVNFSALSISPGERKKAEAIEGKFSKPMFDVGIRGLYVARKENAQDFRKPTIGYIFRQFNNPHMSEGFKPRVLTATSSDRPWELKKLRVPKMKRQMFDAYKKRSYFYPPYSRVPLALNTEELATLYHFPGQVAETPTLARIQSKRGEAPVDLPI